MIQVTSSALNRFRSMVEENDDKEVVLRLYARNDAGQLRYGMGWGAAEDDDVVIEGDGVSLHIEELSVPFWSGAAIDYVVEDLRQGFTIRAPGMGGGCGGGGCGGGCSCGSR